VPVGSRMTVMGFVTTQDGAEMPIGAPVDLAT
jgi:hypothetical protein